MGYTYSKRKDIKQKLSLYKIADTNVVSEFWKWALFDLWLLYTLHYTKAEYSKVQYSVL